MKTVDFPETIAACDLKIGRCRQLIEIMMVKVISLPYIFQVLYVLCFTRPRYQVSVYRTISPLVYSRFCFKGGICLLIAPVPVHCFCITFILRNQKFYMFISIYS